MSFNTALSGLNAAQSDLAVTSNDIANVNTIGFKESRAEFADIFATSSLGSGATAIGAGVLLSKVAQQFNQGNLNFTSNSLDLAISGDGMFVMSPDLASSELLYSRAGALGINADGFIVNSSGQYLKAFPVNADGSVSASNISSLVNLQLPPTSGAPTPSTKIDISVNLPAGDTSIVPAIFDPNDPNSYNSSTSISVLDSLGESHVATFYYVKDGTDVVAPLGTPDNPNTWAQFLFVDDVAVNIVGGKSGGIVAQDYAELVFDNVGNYDSAGSTPLTPITSDVLANALTNGSDPTQTLTIDYASNNPTQFASGFSVSKLDHNGAATGQLSGLDIGEDGVVRANYTNGTTTSLGKIALGKFANNQGLKQDGNTSWVETINSGTVIAGEAGTSTFGLIRSGALESSNVDLTAELVNLITAQRNFQANAKSIETSNTVTQAILQIR